MINRAFWFLCVSVLLLSLGSTVHASDFFWISFFGEPETTSGEQVIMMQIDDKGGVIIGPKVVLDVNDLALCNSSTAMSHGKPGKINLWLACETEFFRAVISKSDLTFKLKKISLTTSDDGAIHATQNSLFLAVEVDPETLKAFGVTQDGLPNGTSWRLSPRTDGGNGEGGICADGTMAFSSDTDSPLTKLYLQALGANRRPKGDPKVVASAEDMRGVDLTNALANGRRFVVYGDVSVEQVFLQVVDAALNTVGAKKSVDFVGAVDEDQSVALDPLGRFVIYASRVGGCSNDLLLYQALDSNGNNTGAAKTLVGCGDIDSNIEGMDLLME
jgi:hypothetical protein